MIEKMQILSMALNRQFPEGNHPYQIMTRFLEESGELAQQVSHFEDSGVKRNKHGEPSRERLAQEVKDVLTCLFQLTAYYGIEKELETAIDNSLQNLEAAGFLGSKPTQA
ncbi:MAG: hypothetical protein AAF512_10805 [Pseudomonadota bacterium]